MSSKWITTPNTRCFGGPSANALPLLLAGRSSSGSTIDERNMQMKRKEDAKTNIRREFRAMIKESNYRNAHETATRSVHKSMVRAEIQRRVASELHLHELSLEARRDRLRELFCVESNIYREEAAAKEPTTRDRIAQVRLRLSEINEQKESARQKLVKEKYLQQAWQKHDEVRNFMRKKNELEAEADRKEQINEKREKIAEEKAMDGVFHQLLLDDVAKKAKREEDERIARHRVAHEQVEVWTQQVIQAQGGSKEDREKREAIEREILFEQEVLRKKEDEYERKVDRDKKKFVHAMYDDSIRLANEKKDRIKLEENLFDLNHLEIVLKTSNEEETKKLQRKKELHEEIGKYCADLKATRQEEMRLKSETERIIQQEMNKAAEKETQLRKAQAAASKRLLCDVIAGQKIQREEKSVSKGLTREQRAEQRQKVIQEADALRQQQMHDRQQLHEKKRQYGSDLVGQMNYDRCRRIKDEAEESRLIQSQQAAEEELAKQLDYLIQNPLSNLHPLRRKYNEMMNVIPTSFCKPT